MTVAVLALGLAACTKNNADNTAANETAVENAAATDVNAAANNATAAADNALNAAGNAVENAGEAVDNAQRRRRQRRRERDPVSRCSSSIMEEGRSFTGGPFFMLDRSGTWAR